MKEEKVILSIKYADDTYSNPKKWDWSEILGDMKDVSVEVQA